jgi:hypothetical protein
VTHFFLHISMETDAAHEILKRFKPDRLPPTPANRIDQYRNAILLLQMILTSMRNELVQNLLQ